MDAPLSPAEVAARIETRVQRGLTPLLVALAIAFAFFALVTVAVRPPGATLPLAILDTGGAVALLASALLLRRRPAARANALVGVALLFTLVASLAAMRLLHLPATTTNVLLVELVGSVMLLSVPWTAVLVAASLVGWALVAWSEGGGAAWLNAGFALVVTSVMAATIQIVRLREARATEQLAAANAEKTTRLQRAVDAERAHGRALAATNDSLEAFAYVIAHDLKEPLRATSVYLDEARASAEPGERDELLARAGASHERLRRLVDGLLEWSRATTAPLEAEPVDVRRLLEDETTRQVFATALAERRGRLLVDPSLPLVLGAPVLLRQALGNLILNALRHNPEPEPQVRLYAAADAPRGKVDLIVEDNGPGMPADVLHRLERGAGERPRTVQGGFGLAIARRAAQRMGGELHFESPAPGGGTRVHVVLPEPRGSASRTEARMRSA